MDKPLTVNEAAEFLSVHPHNVRKYIKVGYLRAHRLGNGSGTSSRRSWRIWKHDLIEFINRSSNVKEGG